jgi:membrane associated rhomboid family serine protease
MSSVAPKIKFETQQVVPIGTMLLIFICGATYVSSAGQGGAHIETWIANNGFVGAQAAKNWSEFSSLLKMVLSGSGAAFGSLQTLIGQMLTTCYTATFSSLDVYQVAANCYFLWAFGASVEPRVGIPRFMMLMILGVTLPWAGVFFEAVRDNNHVYYGPCFLICCFIGATFVFPPEKKINTEWFKSSRGNIFAKPSGEDMTSKYQFKPVLFTVLFIAYQAFIFYWTGHNYPMLKNYAIIGGVIAVFIGYISVSLMVWSATGSLTDGPMRLMTVKMYNDILRLDVGHDMAIRGTSLALGLPPERVKEWVGAQKGKMKVS